MTGARWSAAAGLALVAVLVAGGSAQAARGATRDEVRAHLEAQRERQLERLKAYREAGRFPVGATQPLGREDPHHADGRAHAFVAPNGALCAVAHLIAASGRRDLVDRIARDQNHLCVGLTKDPEVLAWVLDSGLTLEEVVRIQAPGFVGVEPPHIEDVTAVALTAHLLQVEAELRRDAEASLERAVDRWLASPPLRQ